MRTLSAVLPLLVLVLAVSPLCANAEILRFFGGLAPVEKDAGAASVYIVIDTEAQTMKVKSQILLLSLITGQPTAAHFHGPLKEPLTELPPIIITLPDFPTNSIGIYEQTFYLNNPATYDPAYVETHGGLVGAYNDFMELLASNRTYIDIHTEEFENGAVVGIPARLDLASGEFKGTNRPVIVTLVSSNTTTSKDSLFMMRDGEPSTYFLNPASSPINSMAAPGTRAVTRPIKTDTTFSLGITVYQNDRPIFPLVLRTIHGTASKNADGQRYMKLKEIREGVYQISFEDQQGTSADAKDFNDIVFLVEGATSGVLAACAACK